MAKQPRAKKSAPRAEQKAPATKFRFGWSHAVSFVLGLAVTALGIVAASKLPIGSHRLIQSPLQVRSGPMPPWGQLEYTSFNLERPDEESLLKGPGAPPTKWTFDNATESDLEKLFTAPDLTADQTRQLTDRKRWTRTGTGWQVSPPLDLVENLSQAARVRIYPVLGRNPENQLYCFPYFVAATEFEAWMDKTGFSEEKQTLLRKLAYPRGDSLCLSDFEIIESKCNAEEKQLLIKAISRNSALLMKLRVTPDSDLDALARYWGRAGRMKAMKPLLEALSRTPGGGVINVSFFFPEFARMRLYTFPDPATDPMAQREDCYWTALNFFNEEPDNRYLVDGPNRQAMKSDYTEVKTNWAFGDILVLLEDGKDAKHMCVYVADDVVFTKNGAVPWAPWMLMRLPDMMTRYTSQKPMQITALRRKGT